jgi:spore coat protein SA
MRDLGQKIRVVVIGGTLETSLHPVPPVADGAPEWNVFRLVEAAATSPENHLDIHVVSPCETTQLKSLQNYPVLARGKYHYIVIAPGFMNLYRRLLRHVLPLRLLVRRLAKLPDFISWWYLRRVKSFLNEISPHIVIINGRPQYARYLRPLVAPGRLWIFIRGEMGESRRHMRLLDGIVINSDGMKEYVRQFLPLTAPPVFKMPNTLGDEFIIPDAPNDRFTRKRILFTGRLIPEKGAMELLDAFEIVLQEIPTAQLVICGASDIFKITGAHTKYEKALRRRAASMPPGSLQFIGYVPNASLGAQYVNSTVAVFPSICIESFGMVALEAMRCGTPVVASRQPGFEELVISGKTGLLVDDPCDKDALARAIMFVLQDSGLAQCMGQAGYQRSLGYTPEAGLRGLEDIIQSSVL